MAFHKRVFPVMWFGFLVVFVVIALSQGIANDAGPATLPFFFVPIFMAFVGYIVMRRFILDLVDEVEDHGDYLVIRNRGEEARIALADIMNVSASTNVNPPRITLRVTHDTKFGKEISFSPIRPFTLNPFARNEIADKLIERVYEARSKRS